MPQLVLERQMARDALTHLLCVKQITLAGGLRPIERSFGILQKRLRVFCVPWKNRDSELRGNCKLRITHSIRSAKYFAVTLLQHSRDVVLGFHVGQ